MRSRVVCGVGETMATVRPTRVLTRVDLPALGRPTIATKPDLNAMKKNCTPIRASRQFWITRRKRRLWERGGHEHEEPFADSLRGLRSEYRRNRVFRRCEERGQRCHSADRQQSLRLHAPR